MKIWCRPPLFWYHRTGRDSAPMLRLLLTPISWLYSACTRWRLYKSRPHYSSIPVICVGNATVGGSGKTPIVIYLLKSLQQLGITTAAITRGYGGQTRTVRKVRFTDNAAQVGDEPLLLAAHTQHALVSRDRKKAAQYACTQGAKLIVMDDGLQNPQLKQNLSLLVVDAEVGTGNGHIFPAGPLREPLFEALKRIQAVILMKPYPEFEVDSDLLGAFHDKLVLYAWPIPRRQLPREKLIAFAGIARPNKFFDHLTHHGANLMDAISFPNHYPYKNKDIDRLLKLSTDTGTSLITTEKDYVRLPKDYKQHIQEWPISVVFENELALHQLLHPLIYPEKLNT